MKSKKAKVGVRVRVFAALPEKGAFYSGSEGKIVSTKWAVKEYKDDPLYDFLTVKLDGSNDVVCVHPQQCKKAKKKKGKK